MEHIVFLDRSTVPGVLRRPSFAHSWKDYEGTPPEEVPARLRPATIAVTNKVKVSQSALTAAPNLKLIAVSATGYDCVDVAACRERNVAVANIPGYAGASTAEHAMLLMLALRRNLFAYRTAVEEGAWQRASIFTLLDFPVPGLEGAVLGLIGHGDIGRRVEALARAFGMDVLLSERRGAVDLRPGRIPFEDVLRRADVLSLHCPSTAETRNLLNAETLAKMKPEAILINTARGNLVDDAALADALKAGRLGGAGIDVLAEEPPHDGSPLLALNRPNLIVTPHIAWNSGRSLARMTEQLILNLERFVGGNPINLVYAPRSF